MKWKDRDQSQNVEDRRSASSGSRGGPSVSTLFSLWPVIRLLMKSKLGWAILIIGGIVWLYLSFSSSGGSSNPGDAKLDDQQAAFISTVLADTEKVWSAIYKQQGLSYQEPVLVLFRGSTRSDCGGAQSQMGPFYCPADKKIYLDLSFFEQLARRHKAGGDFAQAYVLSHEVAHHIQNLQGTLSEVQRAKQRARGNSEANQLQVRVELQADCYSGIWAHHAQKQFNSLEEGDIAEAMTAAAAIGDDTLQKEATGTVRPDLFTHGTSQQRMQWFMQGYKSGQLESCNTFQ